MAVPVLFIEVSSWLLELRTGKNVMYSHYFADKS